MNTYWITISTQAEDDEHARDRAQVAALQVDGKVVQVDCEPPTGSLIVGDYSY